MTRLLKTIIKLTITFIFLILFTIGCSSILGGTDTASLSDTIANIPDLKVQLPGSLTAEGQPQSGIGLRAVGDTEILSADSLNEVKSEGWSQLQAAAQPDVTTREFIRNLKIYANQNKIKEGVPFDLGTHSIAFMLNLQPENMDLGKAVVYGNHLDLTIYWFMYVKVVTTMGNIDAPFYTKMHIVKNEGKYTVELNAEMFMHFDLSNQTNIYYIYGNHDERTNQAVQVTDVTSDPPSPIAAENKYVTVSAPYTGAGGGFLMMNKSSSYSQVGWGNDSYGGLISRNAYGTYDIVNTEFYNNEGNLVYRSYGDKDLGTGWLSNYDIGRYNIQADEPGAAPDKIYVEATWNGGSYDYEYSTDDTIYSTFIGGYGSGISNFIWKQGGTWASGDAIYNNESNETTGPGQYKYTYYKVYEVPVIQTYLGNNYYVHSYYPLKHLLPLTSPAYDSFDLVQVEKDTTSGSWTDWEGIQHNWSWTDYSYFLDGNGDLTSDATSDISISGIDFGDVYYYNYQDLVYEKTKAAFFKTTSALPPYFQFSAADQSIIDNVNTQITGIYNNELANLDINDYDGKLIKLSTNPEFDDLKF